MKLILGLLATIFPLFNFAQEQSIDQKMDSFFRPIADAVGSIICYPISLGEHSVPVVLLVLFGGGLFFTLYFMFANFTLIGKAIRVVRGDFDEIEARSEDPAEGD